MGLVDGKAGMVTGAASGIGRACAITFAREGGAVVVQDLEKQRSAAEETVQLIEEAGGRAIFVAGDVSIEGDQRRMIAECLSAFGTLDFAHNNAGFGYNATIEDTDADVFDHVVAVNLKGVFLGLKHRLTHMRARGGGTIVNTASLAGITGFAGLGAYTASKHGVVGLTRAAALEAGGAGIRVNCICPGLVRTAQIAGVDPDDLVGGLMGPVKRIIEPEEVAETVVWLASDRASLVNGVPFVIDLGATAGPS